MENKARLYRTESGGDVVCGLCHHRCRIAPSHYGICGVRLNRDGSLFTQVYGEVIAAHVDPIEKKPLYHFFPGSLSLSVATIGCNFRCSFCQNWQISQDSKSRRPDFSGRRLSPQEIVDSAQLGDCKTIAYTYTEPTIFFEYALDTARLAASAGLRNVFVTNGYMTPEALEAIHPDLHACNVDLKSFRDEFYRSMCGARLEPVLETIRLLRRMGIWVEVTTLVVPQVNDSPSELSDIAGFIADVDPDIPWHVSRFHPDFQYLDSRPTPVETLRQAYELGRGAGLKYIYVGNVWGEAEDTRCPGCGRRLIARTGFTVTSNRLTGSRCPDCETPVAGVFPHAEAAGS